MALQLSDDDRFDAAVALHWFASDYHGGQWSTLYSILSTSEYSPGPCERECPEEAREWYARLESREIDANDLCAAVYPESPFAVALKLESEI
jgi:hypothetical protein